MNWPPGITYVSISEHRPDPSQMLQNTTVIARLGMGLAELATDTGINRVLWPTSSDSFGLGVRTSFRAVHATGILVEGLAQLKYISDIVAYYRGPYGCNTAIDIMTVFCVQYLTAVVAHPDWYVVVSTRPPT